MLLQMLKKYGNEIVKNIVQKYIQKCTIYKRLMCLITCKIHRNPSF